MRVLSRLPRLTLRELEELQRARAHCDQVADTIGRTNLQAAPAVLGLVGNIASILDKLLGKNFAVIQRAAGEKAAEMTGDASLEASPQDDAPELRKTLPGEDG